jgi:hypothetical protein
MPGCWWCWPCWLAAHGTAVSLIDIAVYRIPNLLAVSAYGGVTLLLAKTVLAEHHPVVLLRAVLAGISRSDHVLQRGHAPGTIRRAHFGSVARMAGQSC